MPCSQMMSMNCRPPRPIEDIRPARLPIPNDAERKSRMSTIGSATRNSMKQKATSDSRPKSDCAEDIWACPSGRRVAVRLYPVGDAGQQHRQADTEGQDARPVESARRTDAEFLQRPDAPDRAEDADGHADPEDRLPVPLGEESADRAGRGRTRRRRPPCSRRVPCRAGSTETRRSGSPTTTPSASRRRCLAPPATRSATAHRRRGGKGRRTGRRRRT